MTLVLAVFVAQLSAAAPGAMLYATGNVQVNGNAVQRSQAVFEGDRIQTAPGSAVALSANGSSVVVDGDSSVVFSSNSLNLTAGTLAVKTAKGMSARIGDLMVSPASGTARFKLVHSGNMVNVFAMEGDLQVADGKNNIALASGKSLSRSIAGSSSASAPPPPPPFSMVKLVFITITVTALGGIIGYVATRNPASSI